MNKPWIASAFALACFLCVVLVGNLPFRDPSPGVVESARPSEDRPQRVVQQTFKNEVRLQMVQEALKTEDFHERTGKLVNLFAEWAEEDPFSASKCLVELPPKHRDYEAVEFVAKALARQDALAALAFAEEVKDHRVGDYIQQIALKIWGETDPQLAAEYILANIASVQQGRALGAFASHWGIEHPEKARTFAERIADPIVQRHFLSLVYRGWASVAPEEAVIAFASLPPTDPDRASYAFTISDAWSQTNPKAACIWAKTIPDQDPAGTAAMKRGMEAWSRQDPAEASEFLAQLPAGERRDDVASVFVDGVSPIDPLISTDWARSIQRHELRRSAFNSIASYYAKREPDEGEIWLQSLGDLPPDWLADLTRRINQLQ